MVRRAKKWVDNLSKAGRIGVIGAIIFSCLIVNSAIAHDDGKAVPDPPEPPTCDGSTSTATETQPVPYKSTRTDDPTLEEGKTRIVVQGVVGERTITKKTTTYTPDGCKKNETVTMQDAITTEPVDEVIAVGTKHCDPNYSGACVPIASDVDCAGGSGNGPAYVQGPVTVIGSDIYGLDRNGDGIGCEN